LINDLAALPQEVVLILDDYHVTETPAIDQALTFLLDHLPPQMHLGGLWLRFWLSTIEEPKVQNPAIGTQAKSKIPKGHDVQNSLVEPLSKRELEVLRLRECFLNQRQRQKTFPEAGLRAKNAVPGR
jgi:ATP/maltotriose-dependent transcriptional regulator MalT